MQKIIKILRFQFSSKHNNIIDLFEFKPGIATASFIEGSATIIGEVSINSNVYIGNNVVLNGDMNSIYINKNSQIGDNTVIQTVHRNQESHLSTTMVINKKCIIEENCTLSSCHLEDNVIVGSGSIICEGCIIGSNSIIGQNSVIPPNRSIPSNQLWQGNPVQFVKVLKRSDQIYHQDRWTGLKQENSDRFYNHIEERTAHIEDNQFYKKNYFYHQNILLINLKRKTTITFIIQQYTFLQFWLIFFFQRNSYQIIKCFFYIFSCLCRDIIII